MGSEWGPPRIQSTLCGTIPNWIHLLSLESLLDLMDFMWALVTPFSFIKLLFLKVVILWQMVGMQTLLIKSYCNKVKSIPEGYLSRLTVKCQSLFYNVLNKQLPSLYLNSSCIREIIYLGETLQFGVTATVKRIILLIPLDMFLDSFLFLVLLLSVPTHHSSWVNSLFHLASLHIF